jgi:immune inhibitor A
MILVVIVIMLSISAVASAAPDPGNSAGAADQRAAKPDDLPHPLGQQQRALRQQALQREISGKAYGRVAEVARGQFVELERTGQDLIFTVLGEFSDFPHNSIVQPDRNFDNTTYWVGDFNQAHYEDMLFSDAPGANSMRNFYIEQSSNRYAVDGDVTDWVTVPGTAASYDDDLPATTALWVFLQDSVDGWYDQMIADGMTPAQIDDYLSQFDVWDRYDWDGDGNFNEPDGYIDHFQSIHAGEGEEAGGGALGGQAIWSHRWYTFFNLIGVAGPSPDYLLGGIQIGDSSYWVGDYTIEPENGGVGVFTHEFGHDLGLPDLYNTGGGPENSTGFWTLMSSGSWMGEGLDDIGTKPSHMGGWEKFQLGWLNYEVAFAGAKSEHKLGPAETNTKQAQGVFVVLPLKEVTEVIADPFSGSYFYYSGSGNNLDNSMTRSVTLPAGATLTAKVNYEIETDWDYAYLTVNGTSVETSLSTTSDPNGQNFGFGITDFSGGWVDLTADLSAFAGQTVDIGFRYWTDGAAVEAGFMADDIQITGQPLDDAESDFGWTLDGFRTTTGTETGYYNNYYLAEFRQYRGYDETLEVGPYNFGFLDNPSLGNWVEHFPYQDGLMISYWDTSQSNNNTASHPGQGLILPVDAHPKAMIRADGGVWRNRIQSYDSTFGLEPTDALTLHWLSQASEHPSLPGVSVFDDNNSYWDPANPTGSVIVPNTGTQIRIQSISAQGNFMQIQVRPSK